MKAFTVKFVQDHIEQVVESGATILEAAQRAGIILNSSCGGAGTCKKCLVHVEGEKELVKACHYQVKKDLVVNIPEKSRFYEQKILEEGVDKDSVVDPAVQKIYVEMDEPTLADLRCDTTRLLETVAKHVRKGSNEKKSSCQYGGADIGGASISIGALQRLPEVMRESEYKLTAVCRGNRVFALQPGDTTGCLYGLAVDIGTTTVVASLVNLLTGKTVAVASRGNAQKRYGDDVISRIDHAGKEDGLSQLNEAIVGCVNGLIEELCEACHVDCHQIYDMAVAGNSTMQQLFLGVPVRPLAIAPYVSAITAAVNVSALKVGLKLHPGANVYVLPTVAGHVGGDTVAVTLSTALAHAKKPALVMDIGTNGELVLGDSRRLMACSTAAGPALEGARIKFGMQAGDGAIEVVHINDDVELGVIGDVRPVGICGSGLIDAIAELLRIGVIDFSGRMMGATDVSAKLPAKVQERIIEVDRAAAFVLATSEQTGGDPIVLTQRDVRETQLAKGSINAGVMSLLGHMGLTLDELDVVYLAGAFGNYIRPENAKRIGLLPDVGLERVQFIGNAAGAGAKDVLLSREARRHADELSEKIEYVELAGNPEFQMLFSESMFFPK